MYGYIESYLPLWMFNHVVNRAGLRKECGLQCRAVLRQVAGYAWRTYGSSQYLGRGASRWIDSAADFMCLPIEL